MSLIMAIINIILGIGILVFFRKVKQFYLSSKKKTFTLNIYENYEVINIYEILFKYNLEKKI